MSWNETAFGRDDGIICDVSVEGKPCGLKTWVEDDDTRGYVNYACERDHHFAVQYDCDGDNEPEYDDQEFFEL